MYFSNICGKVNYVLEEKACEVHFAIKMLKKWSLENVTSFRNSIITYAQENVALVNAYINQPFAHRLLIKEEQTWYFIKEMYEMNHPNTNYRMSMLGNIGGLLGLVLGCSIISVIEIIWCCLFGAWKI